MVDDGRRKKELFFFSFGETIYPFERRCLVGEENKATTQKQKNSFNGTKRFSWP
jgi:hypothetical protein